jgi:hypothetical protein
MSALRKRISTTKARSPAIAFRASGDEFLVVDRQDEGRGAALLLGELRQVAVAGHAQDFHALVLDRLGQRADAQTGRVLGAEVLVDDDDGEVEFHPDRLQRRPCGTEKSKV